MRGTCGGIFKRWAGKLAHCFGCSDCKRDPTPSREGRGRAHPPPARGRERGSLNRTLFGGRHEATNSNTRRGGRGEGDNRGEEATAIQWTLWGKQAENAAQYLGKGSHVNVVGRVQNNNYDKDGETVYTMAFTAEEIDYLDTKAEGEAIRAKQGSVPDDGAAVPQANPDPRASSAKPARSRKAPAKAPAAEETDDIPF